ncbi:MAG TPA: chemotaxis protein CheW [Candidatus Ozemobacteraceae bacterium]|nr:chemotaxis protein CheW [Candidatus Ozemobacteraceae bacterium]
MAKEKIVYLKDRRKPTAPVSASSDSYAEQVLLLNLKSATVAIAVKRVVEILPHQPLVDIARRDTPVEGVVNVRGRIIPVIDLGLKIVNVPARQSPKPRIIAVEIEKESVGLLIDEVADRLCLLTEPPRPALAGMAQPYFSGVVSVDLRDIPLLDVDQLFTPAERDQIASIRKSF